MGRGPTLDPVLGRFATRLHQEIGAERVLLFGSHARGNAYRESDYDFIVVSPRFARVERLQRGLDLWDLWLDVGGREPIDAICVTPEEFERASQQITHIQAVLPEAIDLLPTKATVG
jgi:predicted nucleotidyltransferase